MCIAPGCDARGSVRHVGTPLGRELGVRMDRSLSQELFGKFSRLIYEECGINLHDGKMALLQARLNKRMRVKSMPSYKAYYDHLVSAEGKGELLHFLDCISTNLTYFFRESQHFDFLVQTVLPQLFHDGSHSRSRRVRFWSAGCSTGEEPYGLAISVLEHVKDFHGHDFKILATDISTRVLQAAYEGVYEEKKMERVPPAHRTRYFQKLKKSDGQTSWEILPFLKKIVTFRRLNLKEPYPFQGLFQCIFCRNVMIYFDKKTQQDILQQMCRYLSPGGYFFVGHSESLTGLDLPLAYVKPAVYKKKS